jgi:hypothetical protein
MPRFINEDENLEGVLQINMVILGIEYAGNPQSSIASSADSCIN